MISERLIGARMAKGYTQQELADLVEVSLRTVQNWEGGSTEPNGKDLRKVAEKLGTAIPYLIGQSDGEPMQLREEIPESDADTWKRRAIAAEQKLHSLRTGLRSLLDMSADQPAQASPASSEKAGEISEHAEAAFAARQKKVRHQHPGT